MSRANVTSAGLLLLCIGACDTGRAAASERVPAESPARDEDIAGAPGPAAPAEGPIAQSNKTDTDGTSTGRPPHPPPSEVPINPNNSNKNDQNTYKSTNKNKSDNNNTNTTNSTQAPPPLMPGAPPTSNANPATGR